MGNPNKNKGSRFERQIVNTAIEHGLAAKRAYASNGISLGYEEDIDGYIENSKNNKITFQAKCRKKIAKWQTFGNADIVIIKQDRGDIIVMQKLEDWLELLLE